MDITYYNTYDLPVPYKGLKFYPVTVKDYLLFTIYSQCLTFEKNIIPDPKIISMSDLEYIYHATKTDGKDTPYLFWLDRLLALCLQEEEFEPIEKSLERYIYNEKGKPLIVIGDVSLDWNDFIAIREIISEQNMLDLPDNTLSPAVRDSLEKAKKYKQKISGDVPATIEDYIVSLSVATGWRVQDIMEMSIRKFILSIKRLDSLIHYKIFLMASLSGMVEFKDKSFIKHWLNGTEDVDKFADVKLDMAEIESRVSMESAKR